MIKIKDVLVIKEAVDELNNGKIFYDRKETGVGDYFWDSLIADIKSLILYAGIHKKKFGLYQMLARRFPYGIYYEIADGIVYVIAVLPMRRDPEWIKNEIKTRS